MENENFDLISVYVDVLDGRISRFPNRTWSPHNGGYDSFRRCLRYLVMEKLGLEREEFIKRVSFSFFKKWKLSGGIELFDVSPYLAIKYSFPEWQVKPWELPETPNSYWNDDTATEAIRWLFIDKLKWSRDEIKNNISYNLFAQHGLDKVAQFLRRMNKYRRTGFYEIVSFAFPEHNFMKWEFKNVSTWTDDEIKDVVRWIFEEKLKWSYDDIIQKLDRDVFIEHNLINVFRSRFHNIFEFMNFVYPEKKWSILKGIKGFHSQDKLCDIRIRIEKHGTGVKLSEEKVIEARMLHYKNGVKFTSLAQKYGTDVGTIRLAVQGKTWSHIE